MFDLLKTWYSTRLEEGKIRLAQAQNRLDMEDVLSSTIEEASNLVTEKSSVAGWDRTGGVSAYSHTPADQQSMLKQCRNFARFDPNAKAALLTAIYYIVGEGVKVNPQSEDPRVHKLWREFWDSPRNQMALRFPEIVLRTFRDGEVLLQYYNKDDQNLPSWKTAVRFRDVELLTTPPSDVSGAASQGILVDPNDPEKPLTYFLRRNYLSSDVEPVDAKEIQHIKILCDSEQKRGESYLQAALELFAQYKDWLKYRIILNKVRTAIVLIRKIEGGTSDDVKAIANKISESSSARTGEVKKQLPRPGTILNANSGVDYRFESANINAGDAAEDGRNIKLGMAAATNMPEYVFGDASNANYASTMIAESPFVKGIRFWQTFFEQHVKEMFRRVVQSAVDAGKLVAPPEEDIFQETGSKQIAEAVGNPPPNPESKPDAVPSKGQTSDPESDQSDEGDSSATGSLISEAEAFFKCDVQWPEIVHRDMKETTDAVVAQVNAKLVSEPTASQMLGHDYDEEVRRQQLVEAEKENNPFKQSMSPFDDPNMQAEIDSAMADLSPEESDAILKSGDASSVMQLLKKKKGSKPGMPGGKPPVPPVK